MKNKRMSMPLKKNNLNDYENLSLRIRRSVLDLIYKTRSPHIGSSYSVVEILVALYFNHLKVPAGNTSDPERDRFILSKGHACAALYAVLAEKGFINGDDLEKFAVNEGKFEQHPTANLTHGIEVSTGSLGHGLSIGTGMALAAKVDKMKHKVYVLLSDGEMNEGSVWEAVMFAGHHGLDNLVALVDFNKMQALGCTRDIIHLEPLGEKWKSFGWNAQEIDGHNFEQIFNALNSLSSEKPNVIILHTIKGKGVSFMENDLLWHYRAPDDNEYKLASGELQ